MVKCTFSDVSAHIINFALTVDYGLYDQYLREWEEAIKKGPGFPLHIMYFEDLKDVSKDIIGLAPTLIIVINL